MKQIDIFDLLGTNTKKQIIESLRNFEIDNLYKENFEVGTYTFLEIYTYLSKNKKFNKYLESLSAELKKYIKESKDCYQDFYNKVSFNTFTKRNDCISIYNIKDKSVGPIYCAEMLKKNLF